MAWRLLRRCSNIELQMHSDRSTDGPADCSRIARH